MNEGLQIATDEQQAAPPRRGLRWLVVLALLSLVVGASTWRTAPEQDPRLVGEWQSKGSAWIFHPDGRLDILMLPARTPMWPGPRWWRTEGDELVTGTQTVKSRVRNWFDNLSSSWTKVGVVGLSDTRYEVVDLTDTKLQLLMVRKPPRRPLPAEVFQRTSSASEGLSERPSHP